MHLTDSVQPHAFLLLTSHSDRSAAVTSCLHVRAHGWDEGLVEAALRLSIVRPRPHAEPLMGTRLGAAVLATLVVLVHSRRVADHMMRTDADQSVSRVGFAPPAPVTQVLILPSVRDVLIPVGVVNAVQNAMSTETALVAHSPQVIAAAISS